MPPEGKTVRIEVPSAFLPYAEAALVRFGYVFPENPARLDGSQVRIDADEEKIATLRQEFLHLLYREKIYAETMPVRLALFGTVTLG